MYEEVKRIDSLIEKVDWSNAENFKHSLAEIMSYQNVVKDGVFKEFALYMALPENLERAIEFGRG